MNATRYYEFHTGTPNAYIIASRGDHWEGDPTATRLSAPKGKARLAEQSRARLLEILKPGDTVYCILRHVSRSGMYRVIDFYAPDKKTGEPIWLSGFMKGLGIGEEPRGRHDGIGMGGCGMDMGFAAVYDLGYYLWPNGTDKPHGTRNGEPDSAGGYALKHRWM